MVCRLVQQQDIRVLQDQPRQIHAGLFAAGQLVKELLPHVRADGQAVGHLVFGGGGVIAAQRLEAGGQVIVPPQHGVVALALCHPVGQLIHFRLQCLHPLKSGVQYVLHRVPGGIDGDL